MINYDLNKIKAIIFDVDGVLSRQTITLSSAGEPLRTVNIKDGYAIQLAQKKGVRIVILTGGNSHAIQVRYENLGVEDIFMGCSVKIKTYEEFKQKYSITDEEIIKVHDFKDFMEKTGLSPEHIMYAGDDIPDYEIMRRCGCPCCPADACSDIKEISTYISACNGGDGVGRDVVEQVLRAKGLWLSDAKAFGW